MSAPAYTHRNGENAHPTIEGLYWVREDKEGGSVVSVYWQEEIPADDEMGLEAIPAHFEVYVIGSEVDLAFDEFSDDTQWWGPLVAPWELA